MQDKNKNKKQGQKVENNDKYGRYLIISVITLNVSGLKIPAKRQRLSEWVKNKTQQYAVYKKST